MGILRLVAPEKHQQLCRAKISDLQALEELNRIANRTHDWWRDDQRRNEYRVNAVLEAVLIGWYRSSSNSWSYDTPLLRKRRKEATEGAGYPHLVVQEALHSAYRNSTDFREAMNRLQGDLEVSSSEPVPSEVEPTRKRALRESVG